MPSNWRGYTLIEVLIVVSILTIIFTVGFARYRDYERRQKVVTITRQVKGDLRLAQEEALSGRKPSGCTGVLNGYFFRRLNSSTYVIQANCTNATIEVKRVELILGTTINFSSGDSILFKPIGSGTDIPSGVDTLITVSFAPYSYTQVITITSGGEIR